MATRQYKLNFRNKSAEEQLNICERAVAGATALPPERREEEYLVDAQTVVSAARTSHTRIGQLRGELRAEITRRKELLAKSRAAVTRLTSDVGIRSRWDPAKMMEIGVGLEGPRHLRVGVPGAIENFRGEATAMEGEVWLRWKKPLRRCYFEVEFCVDPLGSKPWEYCETAVRQTHRVKGLQSGVKYWFRVRACNGNGKGPWSNPVAVRVR